MSVTDQSSGMMSWFGQTKFEDLGLEAALQEIFDFQTQDVIKLHLVFFQDSDTDKTTQESITFKQSFLVFLVEGQ